MKTGKQKSKGETAETFAGRWAALAVHDRVIGQACLWAPNRDDVRVR